MRDGSEDLRRRQTSRLWFRRPWGTGPEEQEDEEQVIAMSTDTAVDPSATAIGEVAMTDDHGSDDEYAYFELDVAGIKLRTLNFNDPHLQRSLHFAQQSAWRSYPANLPPKALSATENLQTRLMGPMLQPNNRYRVVDCYNGVVAVEIERLGLPPMRGYCLAADLEAIEQSARPKRSSHHTGFLRSVSERMSQSLGVLDVTLNNAPSSD